jgi:hypothetical protein
MRYRLTKKDFETVFDFAIRFHLNPKKTPSSRTSGASRGLGGVLDSFILGKLVELGVSNVLSTLNPRKYFVLDFDIKENNEVADEPDIVKIVEGKKERIPNCFVEIKNISKDDRWVGLTMEQFETIRSESNPEKIFIIGAHIENNNPGNIKQKDLLGIYLKDTFNSHYFEEFTSIRNIDIVIDYAISGKELIEFGNVFRKGSLMYETEIFEPAGKFTESAIKKGAIKKIKKYSNGELKRYKMEANYPDPEFFGDFEFKGEIELYEKINSKSIKRYIRCLSDVKVINKILGIFELKKGNIYLFNLHTVGRNPALNRNNIWIAKRSISFLQDSGLLTSTERNLSRIVKEI